jgi:hypothetical protein
MFAIASLRSGVFTMKPMTFPHLSGPRLCEVSRLHLMRRMKMAEKRYRSEAIISKLRETD